MLVTTNRPLKRTIQLDSGGFDYKFLGIQVRLDANIKCPPLYHCLCTPFDPAPYKTIFKNYFDSSSVTAETACLMTTPLHELIHYYDLHLSPMGCALLRTRMTAVQYLTYFMSSLHFKAGTSIGSAIALPVPLGEWLSLSNDKRKIISEYVKSQIPSNESENIIFPDFLNEIHVDENYFSEEFVAEFERYILPGGHFMEIEKILGYMLYLSNRESVLSSPNSIKVKINGINLNISQQCILEANAIMHQVSEISYQFGDELAFEFLHEFLAPPYDEYNSALVFMYHFFDDKTDGMPLLNTLKWSLILKWSTLGSIVDHKFPDACASYRFVKLMDCIKKMHSQLI